MYLGATNDRIRWRGRKPLQLTFFLLFSIVIAIILGIIIQSQIVLVPSASLTSPLRSEKLASIPPSAESTRGFIDRQYALGDDTHVIEGWAAFPGNDRKIYIYADGEFDPLGSFTFLRSDLPTGQGALGFIFYAQTAQPIPTRWCVLVSDSTNLTRLAGANC